MNITLTKELIAMLRAGKWVNCDGGAYFNKPFWIMQAEDGTIKLIESAKVVPFDWTTHANSDSRKEIKTNANDWL